MICLFFCSFEWMVEKVKTARQLGLGDYTWAFRDGWQMIGKGLGRDYFLLQPHSPSAVGNRHSLWNSDKRVIWRFPQEDISKLILHKEDILTEDGWRTGIGGLGKKHFKCKLGSCQDPAMLSNSSLGDVICYMFWRGSYAPRTEVSWFWGHLHHPHMRGSSESRTEISWSWDHLHPPLTGSSESRTDVWPAHHRRPLVCHSLPCNPDNNHTRSHLSISTRPFQQRHYLLQLRFCFARVFSSVNSRGARRHHLICHNMPELEIQRLPEALPCPIICFGTSHPLLFSYFPDFQIQVMQSFLKTLKQRKWDVLLSYIR